MFTFNSLSLFIIQSLIFSYVAYDYCGNNEQVKKLCLKEKHTICTLDKEFANGSKLKKMVPITRHIRKLFLREHNNLREKVAAGLLKSNSEFFPKAARMLELQWDKELAYIAGKHAAKCQRGYDKCRNTRRYNNSGQNFAWQGEFFQIKPETIIVNAILSFEMERLKVKDGKINVDAGWTQAGWLGTKELTVIINEQNSRVGCALAFCEPSPEKLFIPCSYHVTCNYDYNNIEKVKIYKSTKGAAASECEYWGKGWKKSDNYKHLCEPAEAQ